MEKIYKKMKVLSLEWKSEKSHLNPTSENLHLNELQSKQNVDHNSYS